MFSVAILLCWISRNVSFMLKTLEASSQYRSSFCPAAEKDRLYLAKQVFSQYFLSSLLVWSSSLSQLPPPPSLVHKAPSPPSLVHKEVKMELGLLHSYYQPIPICLDWGELSSQGCHNGLSPRVLLWNRNDSVVAKNKTLDLPARFKDYALAPVTYFPEPQFAQLQNRLIVVYLPSRWLNEVMPTRAWEPHLESVFIGFLSVQPRTPWSA